MIGDRAIAGLAAAAAIVCAAGALAQTFRLARADVVLAKTKTALATEQRGRESDRAAAAGVAASAITAYRAEEQRRNAALLENVHAAQQEAARARRELADADAAAGGLRRAAANAAAAARCGAAASSARLPPEARQPPVPASCSPTCLSKWKQLVDSLQLKLTGAAPPASPASAPPTR